MTRYLVALLLAVPAAGASPAKPGIQTDLALGALANDVDPFGVQTDFLMADKLQQGLQILHRIWDKKPVSPEEMLSASQTTGYIEGVYQGLMLGVAADANRLAPKKKAAKQGPPICEGNGTTIRTLVAAAEKTLAKVPPEGLASQSASSVLVSAFLQSAVYKDCRSGDVP